MAPFACWRGATSRRSVPLSDLNNQWLPRKRAIDVGVAIRGSGDQFDRLIDGERGAAAGGHRYLQRHGRAGSERLDVLMGHYLFWAGHQVHKLCRRRLEEFTIKGHPQPSGRSYMSIPIVSHGIDFHPVEQGV